MSLNSTQRTEIFKYLFACPKYNNIKYLVKMSSVYTTIRLIFIFKLGITKENKTNFVKN